MWRSVLTAVLVPAIGSAQSAPIGIVSQPQPSSTDQRQPNRSQSGASEYKQYTFYSKLRQGTTEEVVVVPSSVGLVTTPQSPVSGIEPIRLELEPSEGLTVTGFKYPKSSSISVKFQSEPLLAAPAEIRFKIHADRNAALGVHTLRGKLRFQPIPADGSAPGPGHEVDAQISITIVEHRAKVQKADYPGRRSVGPDNVVLMILLLPVGVVLGVLTLLSCAVDARNCSC